MKLLPCLNIGIGIFIIASEEFLISQNHVTGLTYLNIWLGALNLFIGGLFFNDTTK